jgi:predicted RecA/RadA family phage recombinase
MATREQYSGDQLPYVLLGTGGTAGDMMYMSTGTALTVKSHASGTGLAPTFCGILESNTAAGAYGAIGFGAVYQLPNFKDDVIECGALVYIATSGVNGVGTLDTGTAIGLAVKRCAAADNDVSVKLIPFWEARDNG